MDMDTSDLNMILNSPIDVPLMQFNRSHVDFSRRSVYERNFTEDKPGRAHAAITRIDGGMKGEGILDNIGRLFSFGRRAFNRGKQIVSVGQKATDLLSSRPAVALRNIIPSSDDRARDSFVGEKHALMKNADGKFVTANFMGPGTEVLKRVKRRDPPRNWSDAVALEHDINYTLNPGNSRQHDEKMISRLNRIERDNADSKWNISMGREAMKNKIRLEKLGMLDSSMFSGKTATELTASDRDILKERLHQVEKMFRPGERLRRTVVGRGKRKKSHPAVNKRKKIKGRGVKLPGPPQPPRPPRIKYGNGKMTGKGIKSLLRKVLPQVLEHVGLPADIGNLLVDVEKDLEKIPVKGVEAVMGDIAGKLAPKIFHAVKRQFKGRGKLTNAARSKLRVKLKKCLCAHDGQQSGSGFFDAIKDFGKTVWSIVNSPIAAAASKIIPLLL